MPLQISNIYSCYFTNQFVSNRVTRTLSPAFPHCQSLLGLLMGQGRHRSEMNLQTSRDRLLIQKNYTQNPQSILLLPCFSLFLTDNKKLCAFTSVWELRLLLPSYNFYCKCPNFYCSVFLMCVSLSSRALGKSNASVKPCLCLDSLCKLLSSENSCAVKQKFHES